MSYSIGLLSLASCKELHLIRKIRNEFGHSPEIIGFDNASIKNLCDKLTLLARKELKEPRQKFNAVVSLLSGEIDGRQMTMDSMEEYQDTPNKIINLQDNVQKIMGIYHSLESQEIMSPNDSNKNKDSV